MATLDKGVPLQQVACAVCLKEVPQSEATVAEAADYVVHFCGLDCYQQWKNARGETAGAGEGGGSAPGGESGR